MGALLTAVFYNSLLLAETSPRPMLTDKRIQTLIYNPNEVYRINGSQGYHTTIEFEPGEIIETVDLGDISAWSINVSGNALTIKPVASRANTNMTVKTDKRGYLFHLVAPEIQYDGQGRYIFPKSNNATWMVKFNYNHHTQKYISQDTKRKKKPGAINVKYTAMGDYTNAPLEVYDDAEFTYFKFGDHTPIPAIFSVDSYGNESLVNYRVENGVIVIEAVEAQFSLRNGEDVTNIFNERFV